MLLTITTTHAPATDLGFLLHKHPDRLQSFDLSFGKAHVFYPEATAERCTAALLLEVDPVGLVRKPAAGGGFALDQYVNDRPYVASSFLSVAIAQVFGSALQGKSKERAELAERAIPLAAQIDVLPVRGGERMVQEVFEPLGYAVTAERHAFDERFPEWGPSPYYRVRLAKETTVTELLSHLYVLVPMFDNQKHYFVGESELEKLVKHGEGWLEAHPLKALIARRYLRHQASLTRAALARLVEEAPEEDDVAAPEGEETPADARDKAELALDRPLSLHTQRLGVVLAALRAAGARRVLDLGCGEGKLVREILADRQFEEIVGLDLSIRALEIARERLDRLPERQRQRVKLLHGSLLYRDQRLAGFDAAALVEVIEHLDPPRLAALERTVFEFARPATVVVTTPNREYNALWETLPAGAFRHSDHRFEWTRAEFASWCAALGRFGYASQIVPIGAVHPELGPPTQMAVFTRL